MLTKIFTMLMVLIMFCDQYRELIGENLPYIIGFATVTVVIDWLVEGWKS